MAKRKCEPLPKCACPCCGAILCEKTIERHLTGTHLPTHIKVTHAAAHLDSVDNLSGDVSSDDSDDSRDSRGLDIESSDANVLDIDVLSTVNEPDNEPDAPHINITVNESDAPCVNITQDTWSGCRAQVNDYIDSNTEDKDYEDDQPHQTDPSEEDFDFDFEEEMGTHNGLGTDDLIDEDF